MWYHVGSYSSGFEAFLAYNTRRRDCYWKCICGCETDGLVLTLLLSSTVYVKIQATPFLTFSERNIPQNTPNY